MRVSLMVPGIWLARGLAVVLAAAGLAGAAPAAAQCELCVTKSFSPSTIQTGQTSTLTIAMRNADAFGNQIDFIQFSDTFPQGMTLVAAPANQCGGTVTPLPANAGFRFVNGIVDVGMTCSITVTVMAVAQSNTTLVNTTDLLKVPPGASFAFDFDDSNGTEPPASGRLTVGVGVPPTIVTAPPPSGLLGVPYSYRVGVAGTPTVAVSAIGVPPGLTFDPATLQFSGTPTQVGAFPGAITAANGLPPDAVQSYFIVITVPPLAIITPPSVFALPMNAGAPVNVMLVAEGGVPPYAWTPAGGNLPPGVTLGGNGSVTGTPTLPGTYTFIAGVTDSRGTRTTQTYTITVVKGTAGFTVLVTPTPAISGQTLTVTATLTGGVTPTGSVEVWVAGSATRCPAPFKFGNPANPVAPTHIAAVDASGRAVVPVAKLEIDDYGVCAHYTGDAVYAQAFAGPIDAYVIKGIVGSPPGVVLDAPASAVANSTIPVLVTVSSADPKFVPTGMVHIQRNGQQVATVLLNSGTASAMVPGPGDSDVTLAAVYDGDGAFTAAVSPNVVVVVNAFPVAAIPALSPALLALLALLLGIAGIRRFRS